MKARFSQSFCMLLAATLASAFASAGAAEPALLSRAELAKADGEQIYRHVCQGCHMADGRGASGAGNYPALAGNPRLASAQYAALVVLHGRNNMPAFAMRSGLGGFEAMTFFGLDDAQVAGVVNYVRSHFGNEHADAISTADVLALHPEPEKKP